MYFIHQRRQRFLVVMRCVCVHFISSQMFIKKIYFCIHICKAKRPSRNDIHKHTHYHRSLGCVRCAHRTHTQNNNSKNNKVFFLLHETVFLLAKKCLAFAIVDETIEIAQDKSFELLHTRVCFYWFSE